MSQGFDLERLKTLVEMMEEHGLTEISLRRGDEHWRLRRGGNEFVQMVPAGPYSGHASHMPHAPAPLPSPAEPAAGSQPDGTIPIKSPTVGTYYAAPSPEDPPFVSVGSRVNPDTVVCVVEAMKVFNQIPAEVSGTIVEILVKNGDSIEFGQPLFKVRPG